MNKYIYAWAILAVFFYSFISCKKQKEPDVSDALYTFTNHLNEPIIVKIFPDSGYDEQRITRLQINPGRRAIVPNTIFYQTGSIPTRLAYYWATTDYKISNWSIDPWKKFWYDPTTPKRNIDIYGSDGNDKMNFFLNHMDDDYYVSIPPKNMDDSNDVRWEAIDAFDSLGNSVWNSLTAKDRKRSVALTWFKTGGYLPYGDTTGVYSQSFHYSITDTIGSYILNCDYYSGRYNVDIRLVTDCRPYANIVTHQKGRAYLILDNKPPYYLMAKQ